MKRRRQRPTGSMGTAIVGRRFEASGREPPLEVIIVRVETTRRWFQLFGEVATPGRNEVAEWELRLPMVSTRATLADVLEAFAKTLRRERDDEPAPFEDL